MDLKGKIKGLAASLQPYLVECRSHLHRHPELSFEEVNTSAFLVKVLEHHGISYETGWAGHGISGLMSSENMGNRIVALRADMDALPIEEQNECEYRSQNPGVMHACGHDVHMTWLIGALIILNKLKEDWKGSVKFIFQPGEEKLPGGAYQMIQQGILQNPTPHLIIGQHVQPGMPVGTIGLKKGVFMASCDEIYLEIIGKGGHAALPHLCINPIPIAAQAIIALQTIVQSENAPADSLVLSIGKLTTQGGATNVIPERVYLEGTFRCLNEEQRLRILEKLEIELKELVNDQGATLNINIKRGYPCLLNDEFSSQSIMEWATDYLGEGHTLSLNSRLTSEDFAYYSQQIPAVFYRTGIGRDISVHHPRFDIDDRCLEIGAGLMAWLAIQHNAGNGNGNQ